MRRHFVWQSTEKHFLKWSPTSRGPNIVQKELKGTIKNLENNRVIVNRYNSVDVSDLWFPIINMLKTSNQISHFVEKDNDVISTNQCAYSSSDTYKRARVQPVKQNTNWAAVEDYASEDDMLGFTIRKAKVTRYSDLRAYFSPIRQSNCIKEASRIIFRNLILIFHLYPLLCKRLIFYIYIIQLIRCRFIPTSNFIILFLILQDD